MSLLLLDMKKVDFETYGFPKGTEKTCAGIPDHCCLDSVLGLGHHFLHCLVHSETWAQGATSQPCHPYWAAPALFRKYSLYKTNIFSCIHRRRVTLPRLPHLPWATMPIVTMGQNLQTEPVWNKCDLLSDFSPPYYYVSL